MIEVVTHAIMGEEVIVVKTTTKGTTMSKLFTQDSSILRNAGQGWNFFHLLGCNSVNVHGANLNTQGTVTGQLPNHKYLRYTAFLESDLPYINEKLSECYNSSTRAENGIVAAALHFKLDLSIDSIVDVRCGGGTSSGGVAIICKTLDPTSLTPDYFCLEFMNRRLGVL